jgi:hypothetical protein
LASNVNSIVISMSSKDFETLDNEFGREGLKHVGQFALLAQKCHLDRFLGQLQDCMVGIVLS